MPEFIQVLTTIDAEAAARRIAQSLVEAQLAGCVQVIGPLTSTYRWRGAVETAQEWLCLVKTSRTLYPKVEAAIRALHTYETPEILAVPVLTGSDDYLAWLGDTIQTTRIHLA